MDIIISLIIGFLPAVGILLYYSKKLDALEEANSDYQRRIETLDASVHDARKEREHLDGELSRFQKHCTKLREEMVIVEKEIDIHRDRLIQIPSNLGDESRQAAIVFCNYVLSVIRDQKSILDPQKKALDVAVMAASNTAREARVIERQERFFNFAQDLSSTEDTLSLWIAKMNNLEHCLEELRDALDSDAFNFVVIELEIDRSLNTIERLKAAFDQIEYEERIAERKAKDREKYRQFREKMDEVEDRLRKKMLPNPKVMRSAIDPRVNIS